ncbi:hypothetical protein AAGF08_12440 [Algoriphagus sp. SE2]|uniref:hypothetical protein n=1 Tax=Algoriphagus sp. SE2 TaxID=3141536 RepID=UPI0031CD8002
MQVKQSITSIFPSMGFWMMLFILGVFGGFYVTYFSKLTESLPSVTHIHFGLMSLWMIIAISQPLLIRYKKINLHQKVGKLSYLVIPLVIFTSFLMMRYSYQSQLSSLTENLILGNESMSIKEGLSLLASFQAIGFVYLIWLGTFYGLAIYFRKTPMIHARFMIAAVLTFMGPTLDRILYFVFDLAYILPGVPAEYASFLLIDLILLFLLMIDIRKGRSIWPITFALSFYILFQILYTTVQKTEPFSKLVNFLLN